ncbi:hypothetical protein Bbelb_282950 [Branchiostoma belcheri]|nr:hypothetical protein Bbelb_282950 [Branchiostoma belcheri]
MEKGRPCLIVSGVVFNSFLQFSVMPKKGHPDNPLTQSRQTPDPVPSTPDPAPPVNPLTQSRQPPDPVPSTSGEPSSKTIEPPTPDKVPCVELNSVPLDRSLDETKANVFFVLFVGRVSPTNHDRENNCGTVTKEPWAVVYGYFANSSSRQARLKDMHDTDDVKSFHAIRWLSFSEANVALNRTLKAVMAVFQQDAETLGDVIAEGLGKAIMTYEFVGVNHLLCDVLGASPA